MTCGPATTSVSLLARATVLPASSAAQVPSGPPRPRSRLSTRSVAGSWTIRTSRPGLREPPHPVPRSSRRTSPPRRWSGHRHEPRPDARHCSISALSARMGAEPPGPAAASRRRARPLQGAPADRTGRAQDHDTSERVSGLHQQFGPLVLSSGCPQSGSAHAGRRHLPCRLRTCRGRSRPVRDVSVRPRRTEPDTIQLAATEAQ